MRWGVPANPPSQGDRIDGPARPDFKAAATKLGVAEQQLKDALGVPANPPSQGDRNHGHLAPILKQQRQSWVSLNNS